MIYCKVLILQRFETEEFYTFLDIKIVKARDKILYKIIYLIFNYPHKHYTFKQFRT